MHKRPSSPTGIRDRLSQVLDGLVRWLARYSVAILRVCLGLVFLAFGALKFFPGASPAADLAEQTMHLLSLGLLSGQAALTVVATAECIVGITFVTGRFMKIGVLVLAGSLIGIMSPMLLFTARLFPGGLPTLEGQYVFKDIILAAAGLVVAAATFGARFVARDRTENRLPMETIDVSP